MGEKSPQVIIHRNELVETKPMVVESVSPLVSHVDQAIHAIQSNLTKQNQLFDDLITSAFASPDPVQQAEQVEILMQNLALGSSWLLARLGEVIVRAQERHLYRNVHQCQSMDEWFRVAEIDLDTARRAYLLYTNADFFARLQRTPNEVIKASTAQITAIAAVNDRVESRITTQVKQNLPRNATPAQKQEEYERLWKQEQPKIESEVDQIMIADPIQVQNLKHRILGTPQKALLALTCDIDPNDPGQVIYSGRAPLSRDMEMENNFAYITSGYSIKFQVPGVQGYVSYQDLMEKIQNRMEAVHGEDALEDFLSVSDPEYQDF